MVVTLPSVDIYTLIQQAEELKEKSYTSPMVKVWKKKARDFVRENYGEDYLKILNSSLFFRQVIMNEAHGQRMHANAMAQAIELLEGLKAEPEIDKNEKTRLMPSSKTMPKLKLGEPGKAGQPGRGGTVYIQAGRVSVDRTGRISADGGDYISQRNVKDSPVQTGGTNINIGDITNSFNKIREQVPQNIDLPNQKKTKELLDSLERELKKDSKEPSKITKIFGQIKRTSKWLAGQLAQGAIGGLIKAYIPPIMAVELPSLQNSP